MKKFKAYINGKFIDTDKKLNIISPLDHTIAGSVPALSEKEINQAYTAAKKTFKSWSQVKEEKRIDVILEFIKLLGDSKKELAEIMHLETAKNIEDCIVEIERTIIYMEQTLEAWQDIKVKKIYIGQKESTQIRLPLGVILAISPYNYPVNLSLAKIMPALLVGNTIVFKAATNGSLTGAFIAKLFSKTDIPNGVFNYVSGAGRDIGDILTGHKEINMITFTGGVEVGKQLAKIQPMKPLVLELGGNDAAYVRYDADIDLSVNQIIGGAFGYSGQRCTAIKRLILHKKIATKFMNAFVNQVKKLQMVPLINESSALYVNELFEDAITNGGKIILEPKFNLNKVSQGIVETTSESRLWREEQFGPVLPYIIIEDEKRIVELINDTDFGLQNSIFTSDIKWAKDISLKLESGAVNINAKSSRGPDVFPFSGIKNSGFGTQGITDALISMTRIHNIVNNK